MAILKKTFNNIMQNGISCAIQDYQVCATGGITIKSHEKINKTSIEVVLELEDCIAGVFTLSVDCRESIGDGYYRDPCGNVYQGCCGPCVNCEEDTPYDCGFQDITWEWNPPCSFCDSICPPCYDIDECGNCVSVNPCAPGQLPDPTNDCSCRDICDCNLPSCSGNFTCEKRIDYYLGQGINSTVVSDCEDCVSWVDIPYLANSTDYYEIIIDGSPIKIYGVQDCDSLLVEFNSINGVSIDLCQEDDIEKFTVLRICNEIAECTTIDSALKYKKDGQIFTINGTSLIGTNCNSVDCDNLEFDPVCLCVPCDGLVINNICYPICDCGTPYCLDEGSCDPSPYNNSICICTDCADTDLNPVTGNCCGPSLPVFNPTTGECVECMNDDDCNGCDECNNNNCEPLVCDDGLLLNPFNCTCELPCSSYDCTEDCENQNNCTCINDSCIEDYPCNCDNPDCPEEFTCINTLGGCYCVSCDTLANDLSIEYVSVINELRIELVNFDVTGQVEVKFEYGNDPDVQVMLDYILNESGQWQLDTTNSNFGWSDITVSQDSGTGNYIFDYPQGASLGYILQFRLRYKISDCDSMIFARFTLNSESNLSIVDSGTVGNCLTLHKAVSSLGINYNSYTWDIGVDATSNANIIHTQNEYVITCQGNTCSQERLNNLNDLGLDTSCLTGIPRDANLIVTAFNSDCGDVTANRELRGCCSCPPECDDSADIINLNVTDIVPFGDQAFGISVDLATQTSELGLSYQLSCTAPTGTLSNYSPVPPNEGTNPIELSDINQECDPTQCGWSYFGVTPISWDGLTFIFEPNNDSQNYRICFQGQLQASDGPCDICACGTVSNNCFDVDTSENIEVCLGESFISSNNITYIYCDESGECNENTYTSQTTIILESTQNGDCTIVNTISLSILEPEDILVEVTICEGEDYYNEQTEVTFENITESGMYEQEFIDSNGCTATITADILLFPRTEVVSDVVILCPNESYSLDEVYTNIDPSDDGCTPVINWSPDSIYQFGGGGDVLCAYEDNNTCLSQYSLIVCSFPEVEISHEINGNTLTLEINYSDSSILPELSIQSIQIDNALNAILDQGNTSINSLSVDIPILDPNQPVNSGIITINVKWDSATCGTEYCPFTYVLNFESQCEDVDIVYEPFDPINCLQPGSYDFHPDLSQTNASFPITITDSSDENIFPNGIISNQNLMNIILECNQSIAYSWTDNNGCTGEVSLLNQCNCTEIDQVDIETQSLPGGVKQLSATHPPYNVEDVDIVWNTYPDFDCICGGNNIEGCCWSYENPAFPNTILVDADFKGFVRVDVTPRCSGTCIAATKNATTEINIDNNLSVSMFNDCSNDGLGEYTGYINIDTTQEPTIITTSTPDPNNYLLGLLNIPLNNGQYSFTLPFDENSFLPTLTFTDSVGSIHIEQIPSNEIPNNCPCVPGTTDIISGSTNLEYIATTTDTAGGSFSWTWTGSPVPPHTVTGINSEILTITDASWSGDLMVTYTAPAGCTSSATLTVDSICDTDITFSQSCNAVTGEASIQATFTTSNGPITITNSGYFDGPAFINVLSFDGSYNNADTSVIIDVPQGVLFQFDVQDAANCIDIPSTFSHTCICPPMPWTVNYTPGDTTVTIDYGLNTSELEIVLPPELIFNSNLSLTSIVYDITPGFSGQLQITASQECDSEIITINVDTCANCTFTSSSNIINYPDNNNPTSGVAEVTVSDSGCNVISATIQTVTVDGCLIYDINNSTPPCTSCSNCTYYTDFLLSNPNITNPSLVFTLNELIEGQYTVTFISDNGCPGTSIFNITEQAACNLTVTHNSICDDCSGVMSGQISIGSSYPFVISGSSDPILNNETTSPVSFTIPEGGALTFTVTDQNPNLNENCSINYVIDNNCACSVIPLVTLNSPPNNIIEANYESCNGIEFLDDSNNPISLTNINASQWMLPPCYSGNITGVVSNNCGDQETNTINIVPCDCGTEFINPIVTLPPTNSNFNGVMLIPMSPYQFCQDQTWDISITYNGNNLFPTNSTADHPNITLNSFGDNYTFNVGGGNYEITWTSNCGCTRVENITVVPEPDCNFTLGNHICDCGERSYTFNNIPEYTDYSIVYPNNGINVNENGTLNPGSNTITIQSVPVVTTLQPVTITLSGSPFCSNHVQQITNTCSDCNPEEGLILTLNYDDILGTVTANLIDDGSFCTSPNGNCGTLQWNFNGQGPDPTISSSGTFLCSQLGDVLTLNGYLGQIQAIYYDQFGCSYDVDINIQPPCDLELTSEISNCIGNCGLANIDFIFTSSSPLSVDNITVNGIGQTFILTDNNNGTWTVTINNVPFGGDLTYTVSNNECEITGSYTNECLCNPSDFFNFGVTGPAPIMGFEGNWYRVVVNPNFVPCGVDDTSDYNTNPTWTFNSLNALTNPATPVYVSDLEYLIPENYVGDITITFETLCGDISGSFSIDADCSGNSVTNSIVCDNNFCGTGSPSIIVDTIYWPVQLEIIVDGNSTVYSDIPDQASLDSILESIVYTQNNTDIIHIVTPSFCLPIVENLTFTCDCDINDQNNYTLSLNTTTTPLRVVGISGSFLNTALTTIQDQGFPSINCQFCDTNGECDNSCNTFLQITFDPILNSTELNEILNSSQLNIANCGQVFGLPIPTGWNGVVTYSTLNNCGDLIYETSINTCQLITLPVNGDWSEDPLIHVDCSNTYEAFINSNFVSIDSSDFEFTSSPNSNNPSPNWEGSALMTTGVGKWNSNVNSCSGWTNYSGTPDTWLPPKIDVNFGAIDGPGWYRQDQYFNSTGVQIREGSVPSNQVNSINGLSKTSYDNLAFGMQSSPVGRIFAAGGAWNNREGLEHTSNTVEITAGKTYQISFWQANAGSGSAQAMFESNGPFPGGWDVTFGTTSTNETKISGSLGGAPRMNYLGWGNQVWEHVTVEFTAQETGYLYMRIQNSGIISYDGDVLDNSSPLLCINQGGNCGAFQDDCFCDRMYYMAIDGIEIRLCE